MRLSSLSSIRIHTARSGMSSLMPRSFSTAIENTSSLLSGLR